MTMRTYIQSHVCMMMLLIFATSHIATAQATSDSVTVIRPVTSSYTLTTGTSHLADTYLSPIKYSGWHIGLNYERMQAMRFSPQNWVMQMRFGLQADRTKNIAGNSTMWYWGLDFSWGMMHRWRLPHNITIAGGGSASLDLGCLYLNRNSNNPASAKAAVTINATGYASWNFNIHRLPVTLRYQPTLPVVGAFFAPDYGELYYEIYLGNHSGLAHCAWWGNYFRLDNLLTADIHLGATSIRVGYSGSIFSSKANDVVTHRFTHAAVIGISGEWISLNPRKPISKDARIISATY